MSDWNSFVESLSEEQAPIPLKKDMQKLYPCGQCAGTRELRLIIT